MRAVGLFHLLDHRGDGGPVQVCLLHQGNGATDVVSVDGFEEIVDLADRRQLFEHQRSLEVALVHASRTYFAPFAPAAGGCSSMTSIRRFLSRFSLLSLGA